MARHVFDNRQVAHVWASQSQATGRSHNGQLYFAGPTIYSYGSHFPIASFFVDDRGETRVAFNATRRSVTTSKHQAYVRQALTVWQWSLHISFEDQDHRLIEDLQTGRWPMAWQRIKGTALNDYVTLTQSIAATKHRKRIDNLRSKIAAIVHNAERWADALGFHADWQTTFNEGSIAEQQLLGST